MGQDYIQNVSKTNQGGISVRCHTSAQAHKLKGINQLGQWAVVTEYAKSEIQSKGVISGIPSEIPDKEIQKECKRFGVTDVRRIMYKRNGQTGETPSVCLTFNTPHMPIHIQLGYESFTVKPYIPPVIRCFICQRLGHTANNCRSKTRCVRCSGFHTYDQCTQKEQVKCSRNHSSAYAGCNSYKEEKKIQEFRVVHTAFHMRKQQRRFEPTSQFKQINIRTHLTPNQNQHG